MENVDSIRRNNTCQGRKAKRRWEKLCMLAIASTAFFAGAAWGEGNANTYTEAAPVAASSRIPTTHLQQYSDLAVTWMQQYLRIDTTNPPGNELRAATFLKKILDDEGIGNQVFEYAPGRADLWTRLPHTTADAKRPIILLNHMDVVTSDATHWKVPPFSGDIKNGYLWGRGAQDMKDEGLAQLVTLVMLKREKVALDRDVIFLAVSDEEAEGTGTD